MPIGSNLQDEQQERIRKSSLICVCIGGLFFVLLMRLIWLQIIDAETNIKLSNENGMQLHTIKAPRGTILDRNGKPLVRNRPSYSLCVLPYKLKKRKHTIENLLKIRDIDGFPLFDSLDLITRLHVATFRRFDPTVIKEDIAMDIVSIIEEHSLELPGIAVETESRREYPLGKGAFHVLGYMGGIPEEDFEEHKLKGYGYGDRIGKSGIERQYEDILRGKNGQEFIEVNAHGRNMGAISNMPRQLPTPGLDLHLSLDADLQMVACKSFPDTLKGGVIMLDPRTGEILVLYSSPSIDPNIFSLAPSLRNKSYAAAAMDSSRPLNNRVVSGTYSPGSTFKLITSFTGLETGKINDHSYMSVGCNGAYRFGNRIAHCWQAKGHGRLDMIGAVKQSCNVYFYQMGIMLGDENINKYASMLGLGAQTGIDLPNEASGWLSGEKAYNQRYSKRGWQWTGGMVLDLAIGQAQVATPLQLAVMMAALGNGKNQYQPHLLKTATDRNGKPLIKIDPIIKNVLNISPEILASMHTAIRGVMEAGGTGGRASVPGVPVGGKTGSAQNPQGEKTHALLIACAPVDNPVVAIAVVVENAGHGGTIAAPIAGDVLRYYFQNTPEGKRIVADLAAHPEANHPIAAQVDN